MHRDIEPENVVLSGDTALVTEFGIAMTVQASMTAAPDGTVTRVVVLRTPAYMAPEQIAADPAADHRVDIYAWGVVAYEVIGGAHPFAGKTTTQQLMTAHSSEVPAPVKPPRPLHPRLPRLVTRCLEKDPEKRPASAAELMTILDVSQWTAVRPRRFPFG